MPNYLDLYYQLNKCDFIFISECLKFNHTNPIFGILPFVLNLLSLTFMRPTHTTTYVIENKDVTKGQESPDIYMLKRETIWSSHSASSTQTPPLFSQEPNKRILVIYSSLLPFFSHNQPRQAGVMISGVAGIFKFQHKSIANC